MEFIARVRLLLRSKGIPTYVRGIEGRRMGCQAALFVCLNRQAEDARRVLMDPDFAPAAPVDAIAFERELENPDDRALLKWAAIILVVVAATFSGLMYLQFG